MKNKFKTFLQDFSFVFRPSYWIVVQPYSRDIDVLMNHLLDKYEFIVIDQYYAMLGTTRIWIANRPYGCMSPECVHMELRPSRATMRRGLKKLYATMPEKELIKLASPQNKINALLKKEGLIN